MYNTIALRSLDFSYGKNGRVSLSLFSDFSLSISEGEVLAILGPSGCGKTTLLNLISGLSRPDGGSITVRGIDPVENRSTMGQAYAFFSPPLLPNLTLLENTELPLELLRVPQSRGRALDMLKQLGLAGFEDCLPFELSGGMKARAGFAAALATEPEVLLLDEPHGALDLITRDSVDRAIRKAIAESREKNPMTVVLVTHSIEEACRIADRCVVLSGGRPSQIVGEVVISRPLSQKSNNYRRTKVNIESAPGLNSPRPTRSEVIETDSEQFAEREIRRLLTKAVSLGKVVVVAPDESTVALARPALHLWARNGREVSLISSVDEWPEAGAGSVVYVGIPHDSDAQRYGKLANDSCYAVLSKIQNGHDLPGGWKPVASLEEGLIQAHGLARPKKTGRRGQWEISHAGFGVAWVVALLGIWAAATRFLNIQHFLLPPPEDVLCYALAQWRHLAIDVMQTSSEAALGLLLAVCFAFVTGVLVDRVRLADRAIWPVLIASQAIPLLAIAPLVHLWLPGLYGIVAMTALLTFFPLAVAFRAGLQDIPREEKMMFAVYTQNWVDTFFKLKLPGSLPVALAGLRTAAPIAVIAGILSELTGTDRGLGKNFLLAVKKLEPELLYSSLVLSIILGLSFYAAAVLVGRLLQHPQQIEKGSREVQ